jgi:hypothetical protein
MAGLVTAIHVLLLDRRKAWMHDVQETPHPKKKIAGLSPGD